MDHDVSRHFGEDALQFDEPVLAPELELSQSLGPG